MSPKVQIEIGMTKLAEHFRQTRLARGLRLGDLARRLGYKNVGKGANRINTFERGGRIHKDLFAKLAVALGIDSETVDRLVEEDRRQFFAEWNAWANEPIRPHLVVRLMAAVYTIHPLPDEIQTVEQAEAYAADFARGKKMHCCLVLSRRLSVWIGDDGSFSGVTEAVPGEANVPYMCLGKKPFLIKPLDHGMALQQVVWPRREKQG
jgi:transcriptional regulator with XRE-family HTH domain